MDDQFKGLELGQIVEKSGGQYELTVGNHLLKGKYCTKLTQLWLRQDARPVAPNGHSRTTATREWRVASHNPGYHQKEDQLRDKADATQNDID